MAARKRSATEWLRPYWEQRRSTTIDRVARAIASIKKRGAPITLRSIAGAASEIDGVPLSPNTIYQNEEAHKLYLESRTMRPLEPPVPQRLRSFLRELPSADKKAAQSRISALRRESKDNLIARLLDATRDSQAQQQELINLRERLLNLELSNREADRSEKKSRK